MARAKAPPLDYSGRGTKVRRITGVIYRGVTMNRRTA
jgi:hypothetical protein